jgi:hypothetical protein
LVPFLKLHVKRIRLLYLQTAFNTRAARKNLEWAGVETKWDDIAFTENVCYNVITDRKEQFNDRRHKKTEDGVE